MVKNMPLLHFTVDSALLEELGERLVGKPPVALSELIKNSYDADANQAIVNIEPEKDRITVQDNGHGMDLGEFKDFWMRIGSPHKKRQKVSRGLKRPLTGSKGVGRLSVQLLANEIYIQTISDRNTRQKLTAHVKWDEAVNAGELSKATANYEIEELSEDTEHGTIIILKGLCHNWNDKFIEDFAKEIWWLQPPFRSGLASAEDKKKAFQIKFISSEMEYVETFEWQIRAVMDIWYAKLIGKNENGNVKLSLEFAGEDPIIKSYTIENCKLKNADFEIRIYHLAHRQPFGLKVEEAREYLRRFGGIHIYDGGFHLPHYGTPDNDWPKIEWEHSRRGGFVSDLLPKDMQLPSGLRQIPTLRRVFGVVNVNTSKEPDLDIMITRDRLDQESHTFHNLVNIIRWAMHFYAMEEERRKLESYKDLQKIEPLKFQKVEDTLAKYQNELPEETYENIRADVRKATEEIDSSTESTLKQVTLLGSLATAGISSLAYQHELQKQFEMIKGIIKRLESVKVEDEDLRKDLNVLKEELSSWVDRAMSTNALFSYLADTENIEEKERFSAKKIVDEIKEQVKFLAKGVPIETSRIETDLKLPNATLVEWGSILQNVFINAFNAMVDSDKKIIDVSSRSENGNHELLIQDAGVGVNLEDAESLFSPFVRKAVISPERRALGYGGTGLGLTIVDMIAKNIECKASFVEPEKEFNTAFSLIWREK